MSIKQILLNMVDDHMNLRMDAESQTVWEEDLQAAIELIKSKHIADLESLKQLTTGYLVGDTIQEALAIGVLNAHILALQRPSHE